ncbi:prepilin-type N-terminal cleavage/methylation domain-containing protein [Cohnella sp. GCM10012308]|uniref:prepilin-type N-terminal cleavage/methylation domain-containing protein n=1 Tax=Cohnella sp. GCM10012308 TaxID=3317329 RepID=UPI00360B1A06
MRTAVMKRLGKAKEDQKGFTLIELLAVIVILAVIAAIAIPLIGNIINRTKSDADVSTARQIYDAAKLYVTTELNGSYPKKTATANSGQITVDTLQTNGFLDKGIALPSTKTALNTTGSYLQFDGTGALESIRLLDTSSTPVEKNYDDSEVLAVKASATP